MQPIAKRLHSPDSARGLSAAVLIIVVGIGIVLVAAWQQSVWIGLAANLVIGAGIGIALVSGLLEVQQIAGPDDLAGLTGVFYTFAYLGFLTPTAIAAVAGFVPVGAILFVVIGIGLACWGWIQASSRKHL
jgi:hypothetical protein